MSGRSSLTAVFSLLAAPALLLACSATGGIGGGALDVGTPDADVAPFEVGPVGEVCSSHADCAGVFELRACETAVCVLATGECAVDQMPDGTSCKDGLLCTGPDFCIQGACGGGPLNCDDDDPCTSDVCDEKVGCVYQPLSGLDCDDGDPCTTADACAEGVCVGPEAVAGCCHHDAECDDQDPCTSDDCEQDVCIYAFGFAPCQDDNPCTLKDHCDGEGACTGDALVCDDGNPCTADTCNPDNGACETAPAADGTGCEDGNPCTSPDACVAGLCVGQGSLCQCTTDLDCAASEDGDLCNGTLKCLDFVCVVDPISVVACNPTGDTACVKNTCDGATGQCVPTIAPAGAACDDQNPCTDGDACGNGLCVGQSTSCDDGDPCTFDACSPVSGCVHTPNSLPCDDNNACTANDQCGAGGCVGVALPCDDGNPCTDEACDPVGGCVTTPSSAACDDGNGCTAGDVCSGGVCTSGANTCACVVDGDCAGEEDADLCNGTLVCVDNACTVDPATVVACNTTGDSACQKTVCLPASGACVPQATADGTACSDGDACTSGDQCAGGACVGAGVSCDDGNLCTNDVCDGATGCANVPNSLLCNDGDLCTGNDRCQGGACAGVSIACDDGNPCTVDTCDPASGCEASPAAAGTPCNDGSACTSSDACAAGLCAGVPTVCDDGNPCTAETCDSLSGCASNPVAPGTPCNDGSACTSSDQCQAGVCAGSAISCEDGNPCTVDSCDAALGCQQVDAAEGTACTDGDPCTAPDGCEAGACVGGAPVCGCVTDADCAPEEDGDLCNGTLECLPDGTCKVDPATVVSCAVPADPCAVATCVAATGACVEQPGGNGQPCDDGDGCTNGDTCQSGVCAGFGVSCDDANPCTADVCAGGACTFPPAFDGQPCAADAESCTLDVCQGGTCAHPPVANGVPCADDGNSCTADVCDEGACGHLPIEGGLPCTDDGNECTFDQCSGGTCQHVSNDPAPVGANQCFPVAEITADSGPVTGGWDACGVADQFTFECSGPNCTNTGAINTWPCADPSFVYDGANTGFEYAYVFVAPVDGTCRFIERDEGYNPPGPGKDLFGVIDWFLLSGGPCQASSCIDYVWENVLGGPVCGGGNKTCSYTDFGVTQGQIFYIVADIFDGVDGAHEAYPYQPDWEIEVTCDATEQLLLKEDFTDAVCTGCSSTVDAPAACDNFAWHAIGGFADVVTGYYLGQLSGDTLVGYDCGATSSTLTFPSASLPAAATSCTLSFDYYAELDPADDGDCVNDIVEVLASVGGAPATTVAGDGCAADTGSSNPIGTSAAPVSQTKTYDMSWAIGQTVSVSLGWSADAANNLGLGVIIDNVELSCTLP